jgi:large subunit ribosomal protein L10
MPSMINDLLLKEVKALVEANPSFIVLDPSKLKSNEQLKLRKDLLGAGAKMKVTKVNLLRIAVTAGTADKILTGKSTVALVAASDMIAAAKICADLEKEQKVSLKGGLMDGQVLDPAGIKKLASMPGKQTLRGMLVNVLAAPIVGFARVIAEIEKKKNPQAGGDAPAA